MTIKRLPPFVTPFFASLETLEALSRSGDHYPPYNIERVFADPASGLSERLRITLAVAGFSENELNIVLENNRLIIEGRQENPKQRHYLYRGIASRQFQRVFLLMNGVQVREARLKAGLLAIELILPEPDIMVKKINISVSQ